MPYRDIHCLRGSYKPLRMIGDGSFGQVFVAKVLTYDNAQAYINNQKSHIRNGMLIALKVIPTQKYNENEGHVGE